MKSRFEALKDKAPASVMIATGAAALFLSGCSAEGHGNEYAYCTGSQEVAVENGASLQGLIEAHVSFPEGGNLMSATDNGGSGLDILAQGITNDYDGNSVTVPMNFAEFSNNTALRNGETVVLPEQCVPPEQ